MNDDVHIFFFGTSSISLTLWTWDSSMPVWTFLKFLDKSPFNANLSLQILQLTLTLLTIPWFVFCQTVNSFHRLHTWMFWYWHVGFFSVLETLLSWRNVSSQNWHLIVFLFLFSWICSLCPSNWRWLNTSFGKSDICKPWHRRERMWNVEWDVRFVWNNKHLWALATPWTNESSCKSLFSNFSFTAFSKKWLFSSSFYIYD